MELVNRITPEGIYVIEMLLEQDHWNCHLIYELNIGVSFSNLFVRLRIFVSQKMM